MTAKRQTPPAQQQDNTFFSLFSDYDINLFKAGCHYRLYEKLGAHLVQHQGQEGVYFAVWAPNANAVSVLGNFNDWNRQHHAMAARWDSSGIWELFIPGIGQGEYYKYFIQAENGYQVEKADPYATHAETAPGTASIVWNRQYTWTDEQWLQQRSSRPFQQQPLSVYELHIGSWRRVQDEGGERFMSYRELANELPGYCQYMGFTHVELMPVMEHPFYGSWGYQITGYFAPCSRYGAPQDFAFLIDSLHQAGIGVILDWVPSHFPTDEHGLGYFDGTHLYEHEDPRRGFHQDWKSFIFNYGRNEIRAFLISNALYWLDQFHIDGLRVDAVASMLYLDYSRNAGEWQPNEHGGREHMEAIHFLRELNTAVHQHQAGTFTIAEESTAWPGVTHPVESGGLGFDLKWMMGWMHDTLGYFEKDPIYRQWHHGSLSFSIYYAFGERYLLPLSHDEVVHGKRSLIHKMPGDAWQQFANLRLLYAYMYAHPGAKLLFMGAEFAQRHEWRHDHSLDWHENNEPQHHGIQLLLKDLNQLYKKENALHHHNYSYEGFEWIDFQDTNNSVLCWLRKGLKPQESLLIVANFTPNTHLNYRVGVPNRGIYHLVFNSDVSEYGGSDFLRDTEFRTAPIHKHGRSHSLSLTLPPLAMLVLRRTEDLW